MRASQISPHSAERIDLLGGHGELAALRTRGRADGRPRATVLALPGYTGSKEDFAPLLDPLSDAGLDVVAVDLPGQYESPGRNDESAYLPLELGEVLAKLIADLREPEVPLLLLAHSYGGLVARGAVLAGAEVDGLVLLGSGPGALPQGKRRAVLDAGEPVLREHGIVAAARLREAQDAAAPDAATQPPELRTLLRDRFLTCAPAGLLGMADGLRCEPDRVAALAEALRRTETPALVVCGEHDDVWSPESQRDMAVRLGAEFVVIPDAGHSPNTENPAALLSALLGSWDQWLGQD